MGVELQLFGKPSLRIDKRSIEISLKKSEALLYYIACEKRVTRDELVMMIWSDIDQATAKKNLRNSLYRLKKDLDLELFASPNKHVIELDPTVDVTIDYDLDDDGFLSCYKGRFLETFLLKESDGFERWRSDVERRLNQKFMRLAPAKIELLMNASKFEEAIALARVMHDIDDFDEAVVRLLMTLYHHMGQYKQITEVYTSLKSLLDEEMGIQPDKLTRDHYYSLIYAPDEQEKPFQKVFGRQDEIAKIEKLLHLTAIGKNRQSVIVSGEAGIGKTKLLEVCLSKYSRSFSVLRMTCYPAESAYAYKAWNDVFAQLGELVDEERIELPLLVKQVFVRFFPGFGPWDGSVYTENTESLNPDYLEKLTCSLFERLLKQRRIILFIDDLQWIDPLSLKLLEGLSHHVDRFSFLATLRNEYSAELDRFTAQLYKYDKLLAVPLERFERQEAYAFMDFLTDEMLEQTIKERLFEESEGNAFFIVEGVMALHQKTDDRTNRFRGILDSRFIGIEPGEMKLLVIASMFFDEVDFDMLVKLYAIDEDLLLESIQNLKDKYILKELDADGHLKLKFTHHKLREHVYEQTPLVKRKILHNRIGGLLEERDSKAGRDVILYQKLIYHYSSAGNTRKHLTYYLKYLKATFDFSHELYPELVAQAAVVMDKSPEEYFGELESLFERLDMADVSSIELKAQFTHMKARYFIRGGNYDEGMKLIETLIELSKETQDEEMLFKAYVQWFYYLIQTDRVAEMRQVLDKIGALRKTPKNDAIALRLMGISSMMDGSFEEARVYFDESIHAFENLGKGGRYVLNIAACYNYISDAYRKQERMNEALEYVEKAIDLCKLHNIMRGSSIFNTNAGIIAYGLGDLTLSKAYFEEALANYETVDTLWKRSEAEGYLGVILIRNGQEALGHKYLEDAKRHASIIGTPETLKLVENLEKYI